MPHKFNASRRHRIPKAKYKVLNWSEYDRGLVQRGDIRFWIAEDVLDAWTAPLRSTPRGQRRCSELAISTTLMLGQVFGQPLRQTEGFVRSILALMDCDLPVPDHTTLARRRRSVEVARETSTNKRPTDIALDSTGLKFFDAPSRDHAAHDPVGQWVDGHAKKHGETRRSWRKLHISVDPATSEIRAHVLTDDTTADSSVAGLWSKSPEVK